MTNRDNAFTLLAICVLAIAAVEIFAISRGLDGTALSAVIGVIGVAIGYAGKYLVGKKKK